VIVRILGEGQYDVDGDTLTTLNELDAAVEAAISAGDEQAFAAALGALLGAVRAEGTVHDVMSLDESEAILPPADASLEEVRAMLAGDGLIPG
jgi:PspA-Associated protein